MTKIPRAATLVATVTAAGLLLAPGVTAAPTAQTSKTSLKGVKLRVGGQTDGLRALLVRSGELKGKAYAISSSTFTSGPPLLEALQAGKIDIGAVGNTPPLFAALKSRNFRIVAAFRQRSAVGDRLLVPKSGGAASVAELKGKRIAYTRSSSAHGFVIQALKRAGLKASDVELKDLAPADALGAFNSGAVDAWATYEPFITIASGNSTVLDTGKGYAAAGYNFVVARTGALANVKTREAIRDYLVRLRAAVKFGIANPNAWAKAFNQESNLPVDIALAAIKKSAFDVIPATGNVVTQEQKLADVLNEAGALKALKVRGIFSTQLASK